MAVRDSDVWHKASNFCLAFYICTSLPLPLPLFILLYVRVTLFAIIIYDIFVHKFYIRPEKIKPDIIGATAGESRFYLFAFMFSRVYSL